MVTQINVAKASPEERNTYQVWYARRMPDRAEYISGRFLAIQTLEHTHVHVAYVVAGGREQILAAMQGENWSSHSEARDLIESLGIHHTSMRVGDVIRDGDGRYWQSTTPRLKSVSDNGHYGQLKTFAKLAGVNMTGILRYTLKAGACEARCASPELTSLSQEVQ
jgi:hypothetical protein